MKTAKTNTIFYVDDDPDDLQMMQEALNTIGGGHQLVLATDGKQGIEHLQEMKQDGNLPCLIVLDLNMPKMDGRKTFQLIRSDKVLNDIPVVIFTTSNNPMEKHYFQNMNLEFITKPFD